MKKLLVSSVLLFSMFLSNVLLASEESKTVRVELKDVMCGPVKEINNRLDQLGMVPVFMAVSEVNNYETMVWINGQKDVIFVRYVDEESACLMGMGALILLSNPKSKIDI